MRTKYPSHPKIFACSYTYYFKLTALCFMSLTQCNFRCPMHKGRETQPGS